MKTEKIRFVALPDCWGPPMTCTLATWVGPGDQAILPAFADPLWLQATVLRGGVPVLYDCSWPELIPDIDLIAELITNRTRMILCSALQGDHCSRLAEFLALRDIPLVRDLRDWPRDEALKHIQQPGKGGEKGGIALLQGESNQCLMALWGWAIDRMDQLLNANSVGGCTDPCPDPFEIIPGRVVETPYEPDRPKAGAGVRLLAEKPNAPIPREAVKVYPLTASATLMERLRLSSENFTRSLSQRERCFYLPGF